MNILALDTSSPVGSIAYRSGGVLLWEVALAAPDGFAHVLFPALAKLRNEASFDLDEVGCFAAANGPGSFTGLRVGLAAIKGLAEVTGKPVSGVSNLRALASFAKDVNRLRVPILDARRGDVYAAVYDGQLRLAKPETVDRLENFLAALNPADEYELISQVETPRALAGAVAFCAELDGLKGLWRSPDELDANYVRRSDAELFWRDR